MLEKCIPYLLQKGKSRRGNIKFESKKEYVRYQQVETHDSTHMILPPLLFCPFCHCSAVHFALPPTSACLACIHGGTFSSHPHWLLLPPFFHSMQRTLSFQSMAGILLGLKAKLDMHTTALKKPGGCKEEERKGHKAGERPKQEIYNFFLQSLGE